jgi:hypothetical protein
VFDSDFLDTKNWLYNIRAGGLGNQELQTYTNHVAKVDVDSGFLKITASNDTPAGYTLGQRQEARSCSNMALSKPTSRSSLMSMRVYGRLFGPWEATLVPLAGLSLARLILWRSLIKASQSNKELSIELSLVLTGKIMMSKWHMLSGVTLPKTSTTTFTPTSCIGCQLVCDLC